MDIDFGPDDAMDGGGVNDGPRGASQRVYHGVMQDLEARRMVPGQRLVETEIAHRFGVGRNAVREAFQKLAGRGVVDLRANRSPSIRQLDQAEMHEILDVAAAMTGLVARVAAVAYQADLHGNCLASTMEELEILGAHSMPGAFSSARRRFYRALLAIGANRELERLFPTIGMHIIYSHSQSHETQVMRIADYRKIHVAVRANDPRAAEAAAQDHVEHVRALVDDRAFFPSR